MPFTYNLPPTAVDLRGRIPAPFLARLGYPPPTGSNPDPMDSFCASAVGYVEATTGRVIDSTLPNEQAPTNWAEEVFLGFVAGSDTYGSDLDLGIVGWRAVILRAVQEAVHESSQYITAVVSQDYLQAFKAGSYSETRRDPETVLRSRGSVSNPPINPWRELSDLLWLLLTADMFDYWQLRLGHPMPAAVFVEQDFRDTWSSPSSMPGPLPGFGAPGLGGDFGMLGAGSWSGGWSDWS